MAKAKGANPYKVTGINFGVDGEELLDAAKRAAKLDGKSLSGYVQALINKDLIAKGWMDQFGNLNPALTGERAAEPDMSPPPLTRNYKDEVDSAAIADWRRSFPQAQPHPLTHLQNWLASNHPKAAINQVLPPLLAYGYEFPPGEAFEPKGELKRPKAKRGA